MKLYDAIIDRTEAVLSGSEGVCFPFDRSRIWKDAGASELVMRADAAFELGGSGTDSVNYTCVTTSDRIREDQVIVYGPDLPGISRDSAFARIVFLETEDLGEQEDEERAYRTIRNIEYVKYHIFPVGYMVRVSSLSHQEQVRISRKAYRGGIRFSYVGAAYIRKYKEIPGVKHVRILFLTEPELVKKLLPLAEKTEEITRTLTHILEGVDTDCGHCSMKEVCDEVKGMRELHLGKRRQT